MDLDLSGTGFPACVGFNYRRPARQILAGVGGTLEAHGGSTRAGWQFANPYVPERSRLGGLAPSQPRRLTRSVVTPRKEVVRSAIYVIRRSPRGSFVLRVDRWAKEERG